jgi:hypothetical protein
MLISSILMFLLVILTLFSKIIWLDLEEKIAMLSLVNLLMLMELNIMQPKYKFTLLVNNIKFNIYFIS